MDVADSFVSAQCAILSHSPVALSTSISSNTCIWRLIRISSILCRRYAPHESSITDYHTYVIAFLSASRHRPLFMLLGKLLQSPQTTVETVYHLTSAALDFVNAYREPISGSLHESVGWCSLQTLEYALLVVNFLYHLIIIITHIRIQLSILSSMHIYFAFICTR
jgi:hypothetical protein